MTNAERIRYYRANAAKARDKARRAKDDSLRRAYAKLADDWNKIAQQAERLEAGSPDAVPVPPSGKSDT
jgi:hypothetical protein